YSTFKISYSRNMERTPISQSSSLLLTSEVIEQLRHHWKEYISGLEMTPTELQLSKTRADRALDLARSNRNRRLLQASSSKYDRPLTALYSSPRTTCRMKKILDKQLERSTRFQEPSNDSHYFLCPQCGLVKDNCLMHRKHAEKMQQRLKKLVRKHPNLQP
ncbi:hypothetical protein KR032_005360, partial [Drosophila birchii]